MTISVHLPKAWHRTVIGNRGKNVSYVCNQFDVKIHVPNAQENSNEVTISGAREAEALAFIQSKLGFKISKEPLKCVSLSIESDEAEKAFGRGRVNQLMTKYSAGIRVPGRQGEKTVVQVPPGNLDALISELSGIVGRDVTQAPVKKYEHRVNLTHQKIAESLFFAPDARDDDGDFNRFLEVLASGNRTLDICVFTITNNRIANVIKKEHRSGVRVRLITDNDTMEARGNDVQDLADAGIPCKMDVADGHMHNKFAVIDGKTLINGSFNWTQGAKNMNYENVMITNDPDFVKDFQDEFNNLWRDNRRFADV